MSSTAKNYIWIVIVLVAFTLFSFLRGGSGISPDFQEDSLTIHGPNKFSITVQYDQIAHMELVELSDPGNMLSGGENRSCRWGTWERDDWGSYFLCALKKVDTAISITTLEGERVVFNYQDRDTTESILDMFHELLADRGGTAAAQEG